MGRKGGRQGELCLVLQVHRGCVGVHTVACTHDTPPFSHNKQTTPECEAFAQHTANTRVAEDATTFSPHTRSPQETEITPGMSQQRGTATPRQVAGKKRSGSTPTKSSNLCAHACVRQLAHSHANRRAMRPHPDTPPPLSKEHAATRHWTANTRPHAHAKAQAAVAWRAHFQATDLCVCHPCPRVSLSPDQRRLKIAPVPHHHPLPPAQYTQDGPPPHSQTWHDRTPAPLTSRLVCLA